MLILFRIFRYCNNFYNSASLSPFSSNKKFLIFLRHYFFPFEKNNYTPFNIKFFGFFCKVRYTLVALIWIYCTVRSTGMLWRENCFGFYTDMICTERDLHGYVIKKQRASSVGTCWVYEFSTGLTKIFFRETRCQ